MKIGILSRGPSLYSTSRLVEAARQAGHEAVIIDHGEASLLVDELGARLLVRGSEIKLPDVVIPRIGANITTFGATVIGQLELLGIPHLTSIQGLTIARDKMRCLQLLASHGIAAPATLLANSASDAVRAARYLGSYPVVVKLLESTHGLGVSLARNRYDLHKIAATYIQLQGRVIVQEYIAEAQGCDLRAFVVAGKIVASMERKAAKGEFRANVHLGAQTQAVALSDEEQAMALHAAALLDLDVAGVDIIRSKRGPLLMEVNASPGLEGIEGCSGVDVAAAMIQAAVNKVVKRP